jgi:hypothetical protein
MLGSSGRRLITFSVRQLMRASLRRIIAAEKMRVELLGKGTIIAESLMG